MFHPVVLQIGLSDLLNCMMQGIALGLYPRRGK